MVGRYYLMKLTSRLFHQIRSTILFVVGILGIAYVTLVDKVDRPTLLLLFAAMIGLPAFLRVDEKKRERAENGEGNAPNVKDGDRS